MRRSGILVLLTMVLTCCEEELPLTSFRIVTTGFQLTHFPLDHSNTPPEFSHRVSGGVVVFEGTHGTFRFDTKGTGIEEILFQVPAGAYEMSLNIPQASLYGQKGGSFTSTNRTVHITGATDSILMQVEANCSMFLVRDEGNQLDEGIFMIERHTTVPGYFRSFPLSFDSASQHYYVYFTPDTVPEDPSAFLWFYRGEAGEEEGGLSTAGLETGYQYLVTILE